MTVGTVALRGAAALLLALTTGCAGGAPADATPPPTTTAAVVAYSTVPDLVGRTGSAANSALRSSRFGDVRIASNSTDMTSTVIAQHPAPGTRWDLAEPVYLTLGGPAATTAPLPPPTTAPPTTLPPTTPPPPPSNTWTYRVNGPNRATITYTAEGGNISQVSDAELPWSTTVENPGYPGFRFTSVSAQNSGSGTISCEIVAPTGVVVSENSSEGPYAVVTCENS